MQNFNFLASLCSRAGSFQSDSVGNPEDRFSHIKAQICWWRIKKIFTILILSQCLLLGYVYGFSHILGCSAFISIDQVFLKLNNITDIK